MINGIDVTDYKNHPRILEVRFTLMFDIFEKEFGFERTNSLFKGIAETMGCNYSFIKDIINKRFEIRRKQKTKFTRWRQEVVFAAYLYGESNYKIAKVYFNIAPSTLYMQKDIYGLENFLSMGWLAELDSEVTLAGMRHYRIEIERFMEVISSLDIVLKKWRS